MAEDKRDGSSFRPGWGLSVAAVVLAGVALGLADWQLDRAAAKSELESGYIASMGGLPRPHSTLTGTQADHFVRVVLHGQFDARRQFLVDNKILNGRPGYLVATPFEVVGGARYLLTRGFVAAHPGARDQLPTAQTPEQELRVEAVVWPNTGLLPLLADDVWPTGWPKRVQRLDVSRMGGLASVEYPFVLRLEDGQPGALPALPGALALNPDRHRGYAFQWFALAGLVGVGWVVAGWRRGG